MSLAAILGPIIARTAADVIAKKLSGQKVAVPPAVADDIAKAVLEQVKADPVMKNEMNEEKPYESRVALGSATGVVGALGILVPIVAKVFGYDIEPGRVVEVASAVMVLSGPLYALYGRFASGLKPLFSR